MSRYSLLICILLISLSLVACDTRAVPVPLEGVSISVNSTQGTGSDLSSLLEFAGFGASGFESHKYEVSGLGWDNTNFVYIPQDYSIGIDPDSIYKGTVYLIDEVRSGRVQLNGTGAAQLSAESSAHKVISELIVVDELQVAGLPKNLKPVDGIASPAWTNKMQGVSTDNVSVVIYTALTDKFVWLLSTEIAQTFIQGDPGMKESVANSTGLWVSMAATQMRYDEALMRAQGTTGTVGSMTIEIFYISREQYRVLQDLFK